MKTLYRVLKKTDKKGTKSIFVDEETNIEEDQCLEKDKDTKRRKIIIIIITISALKRARKYISKEKGHWMKYLNVRLPESRNDSL